MLSGEAMWETVSLARARSSKHFGTRAFWVVSVHCRRRRSVQKEWLRLAGVVRFFLWVRPMHLCYVALGAPLPLWAQLSRWHTRGLLPAASSHETAGWVTPVLHAIEHEFHARRHSKL